MNPQAATRKPPGRAPARPCSSWSLGTVGAFAPTVPRSRAEDATPAPAAEPTPEPDRPDADRRIPRRADADPTPEPTPDPTPDPTADPTPDPTPIPTPTRRPSRRRGPAPTPSAAPSADPSAADPRRRPPSRPPSPSADAVGRAQPHADANPRARPDPGPARLDRHGQRRRAPWPRPAAGRTPRRGAAVHRLPRPLPARSTMATPTPRVEPVLRVRGRICRLDGPADGRPGSPASRSTAHPTTAACSTRAGRSDRGRRPPARAGLRSARERRSPGQSSAGRTLAAVDAARPQLHRDRVRRAGDRRRRVG